MEYLVWEALLWSVLVLRWTVVVPFAVAVGVYRGMVRLAGASTLVTQDAQGCHSCGGAVSLVGRWQCGRCGYVFDGFGFARCAVCGSVPPYLPCTCGASIRNPTQVRRTVW